MAENILEVQNKEIVVETQTSPQILESRSAEQVLEISLESRTANLPVQTNARPELELIGQYSNTSPNSDIYYDTGIMGWADDEFVLLEVSQPGYIHTELFNIRVALLLSLPALTDGFRATAVSGIQVCPDETEDILISRTASNSLLIATDDNNDIRFGSVRLYRIIVPSVMGLPGANGSDGINGMNGENGQDGSDGRGVALGGARGQILSKIDSIDYNTEWIDPPSDGEGVPTGGTAGQILSKIDATDYNTSWIDAPTGGGGGSSTTIEASGDYATLLNVNTAPVPFNIFYNDFIIINGKVYRFSGAASEIYAESGDPLVVETDDDDDEFTRGFWVNGSESDIEEFVSFVRNATGNAAGVVNYIKEYVFSNTDNPPDNDTGYLIPAIDYTNIIRSASDDFDLDSQNIIAGGIVFALNKFWVINGGSTNEKVFAYNSDGSRSASDDFVLDSRNASALGITFALNKFWVVDTNAARVYVYNSNGTRSSNDIFALDSNHRNPYGITFALNKFWIADHIDDKVYAYNSDGTRSASYDFDLDGDNGRSRGMFFTSNKFWVVDQSDRKVYVYKPYIFSRTTNELDNPSPIYWSSRVLTGAEEPGDAVTDNWTTPKLISQ